MSLNYKELSDKAFKLHSQNRLDEAEKIYKQLLEIRPDDYNVLNLIGLLYISKKMPNSAISFLSKALILKKNSYICSNLAKAYFFNNEVEKSIELYKQALSYGETDDIYYSMAISYKKLNDMEKVVQYYEKTLELNPNNYSALYNLALFYKEKDSVKSIYYAEKCLELNKKDEDLYSLLSGLYEGIKNYNSAIYMLEQAIEYNNQNYVYYYNLGVLYSKIGDNDNAVSSYLKALRINPKHIETYVNLASLYKGKDNNKARECLETAYSINQTEENVLLSLAQTYKDLYMYNESISILDELITMKPNCAEAYSLFAMNCMDMGHYEQALNYYNKALDINSSNLNYMHGKAVALKYLDRKEEAKEILEYIVEKDKSATQSVITLGMMYLTEKDFEKGMKLYRKRSEDNNVLSVFKEKIWDYGREIANKDVLIYTDCGLGDTIMYSRYIPILMQKVKSIILQTDDNLVKIMQESFPDIKVIPKGKALPEQVECVIPMMDIQLALGLDFNNIPFAEGYLKAPEKEIPPVLSTQKKKVGLFWHGNKKIFKNRSLDYSYILDLIADKNIDFYSFQIDEDIEETDNFHSLKSNISDYSDTAFLLKNLDVMITIDSSVAHMAGALGVKTFLLLPYTAEWRWFNDNKETPWYKSVKIFRQTEASNWSEVISRVKEEL